MASCERYDNPTLLISQVFERRKEIQDIQNNPIYKGRKVDSSNDNSTAQESTTDGPRPDPFFILKEAFEMKKYIEPKKNEMGEVLFGRNYDSGQNMQTEMARENYNRLVDN